MANPFVPSPVDFSPLGNLFNTFTQSRDQAEKRQREQQLQAELKTLGDMGKLDPTTMGMAALKTGNLQAALTAAQLAQAQADRGFSQGIQTRAQNLSERMAEPSYRREVAQATREPATAADKRAMYAAEDELPAIQSTIRTLNRAADLNDKIFTGFGAGARGDIGAKLSTVPQVAPYLQGTPIDPETGKLTAEYKSHMTGETIRTMGETMKGATTDFEFRKNLEIAGDLSQPPEVRKAAIDKARNLALDQLAVKQKRVSDIKGGAPGGIVRGGGGATVGGVGGAAQPAAAPIAALPPGFADAKEGKRWEGSDGKVYVKRGGKLVPE